MSTPMRILSAAALVAGTLAAAPAWAGGRYQSELTASLAKSGPGKLVLVDFYADW